MKTLSQLTDHISYIIHNTNAAMLLVTGIHVGSEAYITLLASPYFVLMPTMQQSTLYGIPVYVYDDFPNPYHVSFTITPF